MFKLEEPMRICSDRLIERIEQNTGKEIAIKRQVKIFYPHRSHETLMKLCFSLKNVEAVHFGYNLELWVWF
jgi:hypothetical protein